MLLYRTSPAPPESGCWPVVPVGKTIEPVEDNVRVPPTVALLVIVRAVPDPASVSRPEKLPVRL